MNSLADDPFEHIRCDKDGIGGEAKDAENLGNLETDITIARRRLAIAEGEWRGALEKLIAAFEYAETLKPLTNAQIAALLMERVWADLDITSEQSAIVDEAISRLVGKGDENAKSE